MTSDREWHDYFPSAFAAPVTLIDGNIINSPQIDQLKRRRAPDGAWQYRRATETEQAASFHDRQY